ncbi:MAG: hypothetical protein FIA95_00450 [Gemmatimonadetes bacterium]|nr:hypothetical protein [Gemmatimonadota bacterium]
MYRGQQLAEVDLKVSEHLIRVVLGAETDLTLAGPGVVEDVSCLLLGELHDLLLAGDGLRAISRLLEDAGGLLLGFFDPLDPREPRREALVVARSLDGLTELQLDAAWRAGVPAVPAGQRKPFFPEIGARGVKDS